MFQSKFPFKDNKISYLIIIYTYIYSYNNENAILQNHPELELDTLKKRAQ